MPPTAASTPLVGRPAVLGILAVALLGAAVVLIVVTGWTAIVDRARAAATASPGPDTRFVVPDGSAASVAAAEPDATDDQRDAARYLAAQPTAYWLTPEATDDTAIASLVPALAQQARDQHASLALVVYGLPDRDCGGPSAGGSVDDAAYARWTAAIGGALAAASDVNVLVVVEPDSLALATACGDVDRRIADVRVAVDALAAPNVFLYLDGGHSQWGTAADMAGLLERVDRTGVVRGFATNVANYQPTDAEVAYAHAVAALLPGDPHAIIDTSRNGADEATTDWCNPPGRLVGGQSREVHDDVVDTALWVKPPGESDGTCGGGPPAGQWWPQSAVELTRRAR